MSRPTARLLRRMSLRAFAGLSGVWLCVVLPAAAPAQAAAPCSLCHERIQASWTGSPHQVAGAKVKGGFRCQECHTPGLLHPSAVTSANSSERCGRCHWTPSSGKGKVALRPTAVLDRAVWQASRHAAAKLACTSCHSAHRYAEGGDQHLLRQAGDALCRSCHREAKHQTSGGTATAIARNPCVACHDPHGATVALLDTRAGGDKGDFKRAFVHRPVAKKDCQACHGAHVSVLGPPPEDELDEEEAAPGATLPAARGLLLTKGQVFCYLCHGQFKQKFEASGHAKIVRFRRGEEQSPCLGCHLPHASEYERLTRYPGNQLCLSCHPGYAPHHFLAWGGVKQSELQCVKCHNPHGSGHRRLLAQTNVCQMCHKM